jgi:hypothetical protein
VAPQTSRRCPWRRPLQLPAVAAACRVLPSAAAAAGSRPSPAGSGCGVGKQRAQSTQLMRHACCRQLPRRAQAKQACCAVVLLCRSALRPPRRRPTRARVTHLWRVGQRRARGDARRPQVVGGWRRHAARARHLRRQARDLRACVRVRARAEEGRQGRRGSDTGVCWQRRVRPRQVAGAAQAPSCCCCAHPNTHTHHHAPVACRWECWASGACPSHPPAAAAAAAARRPWPRRAPGRAAAAHRMPVRRCVCWR